MLNHKGKLITFEGPEKCGKTTLWNFSENYLKDKGLDVMVSREPGGTIVSEIIRRLLLNPDFKIADRAELALYEASRSQHVKRSLIPFLKKNYIILLDRFYDSTLAYQGFGREINIKIIDDMNKFFSYGLEPDLTFIIDIPVEETFKRMTKQNKTKDRIEQETKDFHKKVRQGYLKIAKKYDRCILIDNSGQIENAEKEIKKHLDEFLENYFKAH